MTKRGTGSSVLSRKQNPKVVEYIVIIGCGLMSLFFIVGIAMCVSGPFVHNNERTVVIEIVQLSKPYINSTINKAGYDLVPLPANIPEHTDIGIQFSRERYAVIAVGIIVMFYGIVGFTAILKNVKLLLFIDMLILLAAVCAQSLLYSTQTSPYSSLYAQSVRYLKEQLRQSYSLRLPISPFTKMFNGISLALRCCGVENIDDFPVNISFFDGQITTNFAYVPVCCSLIYGDISDNIYDQLFTCSEGYVGGEIVERGCMKQLYDYLQMHGGDSLRRWIGSLFILQMISFVTIVLRCVTKRAENDIGLLDGEMIEPSKQKDPTPEKIEILDDSQRRAFKPQFKTSSSMKAETSRYPSTEIW